MRFKAICLFIVILDLAHEKKKKLYRNLNNHPLISFYFHCISKEIKKITQIIKNISTAFL